MIFAIVLTIVYVIYYAVMITRDLYGKKDDAKTNEEIFDVSELEQEKSVVSVTESENGFAVADKQYEILRHEDDILSIVQPEEQPKSESKELEEKSVVKEIEAQLQDKMEDTYMFMEDQMMQDDFTACVLNGGDMGIGKPKVSVTPVKNEI